MGLRFATLPALLCLLTACGSSAWARSRRADLTDAFNLTLSTMPLGAAANAGPVTGGLLFLTGPDGRVALFRLGFGGASTLHAGGAVFGVGLPLSRAVVDHEYPAAGTEPTGREPPPHRAKYPTWLSIGFDAGILLGIGARLDLAEFADLLLGLAGSDLLDDDDRSEEPDESGDSSSTLRSINRGLGARAGDTLDVDPSMPREVESETGTGAGPRGSAEGRTSRRRTEA